MPIIEQDLPGLDDDIAQMPTALRDDLATMCTNDLYLFAKGILGYRDMARGCHGQLCSFFDVNQKRFKIALIPRGHYKSSVITISGSLQKICRNPEERILIANETSTNAEHFLGAIKQHAEQNTKFRALFSGLIPQDTRRTRWSQKELIFNREGVYPEPSIDAIGMGGAWTSRHYTHINFDDPISEEAARSDLVMNDTITRMTKVYSLMTDVEKDTFWIIGTRWAFFDVYVHMMNWLGSQMAQFIRGAIEDGEPIFPEKFSLETLANIRNAPEMGEYLFACQYMNNPRNPDVQDFNVQDIRFWRYSTDGTHVVLYDQAGQIVSIVAMDDLDITCTVDPAPAERITSDRNAITVTGVTPDGDVCVLYAWAKRCTPLDVIEQLFWLNKRFDVRVIGIEAVAYQRVLKYFVRAEAARRGEYLNVRDLKAPGNKKQHIKGLQPLAATGHLYIDATMHELRNELADYPLGKHDDLADSLGLHAQLWQGVMTKEHVSRLADARRKLLSDIDGYGLRSDSRSQDYDPAEEPDEFDRRVEIHEVTLNV